MLETDPLAWSLSPVCLLKLGVPCDYPDGKSTVELAIPTSKTTEEDNGPSDTTNFKTKEQFKVRCSDAKHSQILPADFNSISSIQQIGIGCYNLPKSAQLVQNQINHALFQLALYKSRSE